MMSDEHLDELARGMRREWESRELWPSTERAIRVRRRNRIAAAWASGALAAAVSWFALAPPQAASVPAEVAAGAPLLTERALVDVEAAETAYAKSIDGLARIAAPKLRRPESPLMRRYAERMLLLDRTIAELRREIDGNAFNSQLRLQMAGLYKRKQETLEQVIRQ